MELNIGMNIRRLRIAKGLTQEQLAELLTRACLINGGMPNGERFFRWARQKFAGILTDFKNF